MNVTDSMVVPCVAKMSIVAAVANSMQASGATSSNGSSASSGAGAAAAVLAHTGGGASMARPARAAPGRVRAAAASQEARQHQQQQQARESKRGLVRAVKHHALARHADAFGFRVLYHTVLATSALGMPGAAQLALARKHYSLARAYLAPCYEAPSQHLVSALLLMVGFAVAFSSDERATALQASLALRMAEVRGSPCFHPICRPWRFCFCLRATRCMLSRHCCTCSFCILPLPPLPHCSWWKLAPTSAPSPSPASSPSCPSGTNGRPSGRQRGNPRLPASGACWAS